MPIDAVVTAVILAVMVAGLLREWLRTEFMMLASVGLLLLAGVLTPETAFAGFSNAACITIASLLVIAAGVQHTEALSVVDRFLPEKRGSGFTLTLRLMLPVALLSSVVNNTPLVAMLIPALQRWTAKMQIPASRVLLPLSYAAVLGGTITLMGTSTNLVISGLYLEATGAPLSFFDQTGVGLPVALVAILYFALIGHRFLPDTVRSEGAFAFTEERTEEYQFDVRLPGDSVLDGKTIEEAGLRALGDAFLSHIHRDGHLIGMVSPAEPLRAGDVLTFVGRHAALDRLLQMPGIGRAIPRVDDAHDAQLPLFEAVIAASSSLVGKTIRDVQFRDRFQGVVLAIFRKNERVLASLGRIELRPGDLLLIEALPGFDRRSNLLRDDFYLVAPCRREKKKPPREKASLALALFAGMVVTAALGWLPLVTAAFLAALMMMLTGCVPLAELRYRIDTGLILMIGASLAVGEAVRSSGLGAMAAEGVVALTAGQSAFWSLCILYGATMILTELLSNNAVGALMLPVAMDVAHRVDADPLPFAVAIALAASLAFATPFGYQTNLMVMSAGGYRTKDYLRSGLPLNAITMTTALGMIWWIWLR
ncbi:MAG: SLC13 family permease [Rhodothermales bacterium]